MSNFKSGSGNLDFGSGSGDEEEKSGRESEGRTEDRSERSTSESPSHSSRSTPSDGRSADADDDKERADERESGEAADGSTGAADYPYFVRRNNVGDERETRLEIHVRDKVADREGAFRSELAEQLGANEVSKTDAREFALLAAYEHPERVAELMEEEGFGALG